MNKANRTTIQCILLVISLCRRRAILSRYNVRSPDQGLAPSITFSRMLVIIYTIEIKGAAVPTLVSHLSPATLEVCVG
jgi:hypothetical protein